MIRKCFIKQQNKYSLHDTDNLLYLVNVQKQFSWPGGICIKNTAFDPVGIALLSNVEEKTLISGW